MEYRGWGINVWSIGLSEHTKEEDYTEFSMVIRYPENSVFVSVHRLIL